MVVDKKSKEQNIEGLRGCLCWLRAKRHRQKDITYTSWRRHVKVSENAPETGRRMPAVHATQLAGNARKHGRATEMKK